jgi:hypothetical protein
MWWPDLNLFYIGCTLEHISIKRFLAIFWTLTFSGHILTRLIQITNIACDLNTRGASSYTLGYSRTAEIFKTPPIHIFNIFENHTHSYILPLKILTQSYIS